MSKILQALFLVFAGIQVIWSDDESLAIIGIFLITLGCLDLLMLGMDRVSNVLGRWLTEEQDLLEENMKDDRTWEDVIESRYGNHASREDIIKKIHEQREKDATNYGEDTDQE
jgi:hypothetical protein